MHKFQNQLVLVSFVCLSFIFNGLAVAQQPKTKIKKGIVRVMVNPLVERSRAGAPLPVNLEFENYTNKMLEGTLHIEAKNTGFVIYRHQIPDVVLTESSSPQTRHLLLPVQFYQSPQGMVDLQMYFSTETEIYDLDEHPVRIHERGSRNFSIVSCTADPRGLLGESNILEKRENYLSTWLGFQEAGVQQKKDSRFDALEYRTAFSTFLREDLPENPIEFTSFDILVIWENAFRNLSGNQRAALEQWVQAGGSALLVVDGQVSVDHLALLNRFCPSPEEGLPFFTLDDKSNLKWNYDQADFIARTGLPFMTSQVELGRVALLSPGDFQALQEAEPPIQRKLYFFLWKYRNFLVKELLEKPELNIQSMFLEGNNSTEQYYADEMLRSGWATEFSLSSEYQLSEKTDLFRVLLPQEFNLVPPSVILGIMFCYLLFVGPGDYLFLGMLKKRKWTWMTFPLITLGVTAGTLWVINSYMRIDIPERSLTLIDIGSEGQVLRSNSLECYLSQRPQTRHVEVTGQLMSPLDKLVLMNTPGNLAQMGTPGINWTTGNSWGAEGPTQPRFVGSVSGQYELVREHQQWSPEYAIRFSIGSTPAPLPEIPWEEITIKRLMQFENKKAILNQLKQSMPETPHLLFVMNQGRLRRISEDDSDDFTGLEDLHMDRLVKNVHVMLKDRRNYSRLLTSVTPRPGEFSSNLPIIDHLDQDQWCVLLISKHDQDVVIQRRVLSEENYQL